jgi:hypothetical protein
MDIWFRTSGLYNLVAWYIFLVFLYLLCQGKSRNPGSHMLRYLWTPRKAKSESIFLNFLNLIQIFQPNLFSLIKNFIEMSGDPSRNWRHERSNQINWKSEQGPMFKMVTLIYFPNLVTLCKTKIARMNGRKSVTNWQPVLPDGIFLNQKNKFG